MSKLRARRRNSEALPSQGHKSRRCRSAPGRLHLDPSKPQPEMVTNVERVATLGLRFTRVLPPTDLERIHLRRRLCWFLQPSYDCYGRFSTSARGRPTLDMMSTSTIVGTHLSHYPWGAAGAHARELGGWGCRCSQSMGMCETSPTLGRIPILTLARVCSRCACTCARHRRHRIPRSR